MQVSSSAFENGETIPVDYTADGKNISPPLAWSQVPAGTQSLALICDDPDAPSRARPGPEPWVHWILFNIPADRSDLPPAIEPSKEPDSVPGARQGKNSWSSDNIGYRGPDPPPQTGPHRYFFRLYALDRELDLPAGATKRELLEAMDDHIIGTGEWVGLYERK